MIDLPVSLYGCSSSAEASEAHGSGLLTTDLGLRFFEAYRIYSRRWSQEVIFKESKTLLGLDKCQSANFAAQIASTSLVALQPSDSRQPRTDNQRKNLAGYP